MKQPILGSALALAAVTLAALAPIPPATARIGRQAAATATTVQVKGGEFFLRLSVKSAAKPGKITFSFKNIGHVPHDFKINGKKTQLIQPGQTKSVKVVFKKKGKLTYVCTVSGHARLGMTGKFSVGVAAVTSTTTTTTTTTGGGGGGGTACTTPTTTINVGMREYAYDLDKTSVPAGCIQFVVKNNGAEIHNFDLQGKHVGALINSGQTETWSVQLTAGTYQYLCDVGQHANFGMLGSMTVT